MTKVFSKKKAEIPHFPILVLGVSILITIAMMVWIALENYHTSRVLNDIVTRQFRALELRGLIMSNDEVLTRYAHLSIETGDAKWEKAYNDLVPQVTSLLNEAVLLAPKDLVNETVNQSDVANQQLVLMEREAFLLIKQGKQNEAKKIISSPEYAKNKKIFEDGLANYGKQIRQLARAELERENSSVRFTVICIVINFLVLVIAWCYTFRNILLWKRELEQVIVTEME